jgi:hypothetical protein
MVENVFGIVEGGRYNIFQNIIHILVFWKKFITRIFKLQLERVLGHVVLCKLTFKQHHVKNIWPILVSTDLKDFFLLIHT